MKCKVFVVTDDYGNIGGVLQYDVNDWLQSSKVDFHHFI